MHSSGGSVMFKEEFDFFVKNQERLVREHEGKVLAIKGNNILGVYDSPLEAYLETQRDHALGTFMLQTCSPGPDAYTVTIN
jgi:hypothetical protein